MQTRPRIAVLAGPTATILNSAPLVTSNSGAHRPATVRVPALELFSLAAPVAIVTGAGSGLGAHPGYAASKGGVVDLARELALELAPHGVIAKAIAPGFFDTRIGSDKATPRNKGSSARSKHPVDSDA